MPFRVHLLDRTHQKNGEMNMATGGHLGNCSESYLTLQGAPGHQETSLFT
ncbi:hypothetical protein YC2023_110359 [Brassica napus]